MQNSVYARSAYGETDRTQAQAQPRRTEYRLFAQVTHRLAKAAEGGQENFPRLAEALAENQRLWAVLSADLAGDGNGLPRDLRANLISLAAFTQAHTRKVLNGKAEPGVLIEINTAIMRGLRGETVVP